MTTNITLFIVYVFVSSFGLFKLKTANGVIGMEFMVGLAFYGLGFLLWYYVLTRLPLSVAFPIAAGSLVIGTQFVGYVFLNETLQLTHIGGIGFLLLGIFMIFHNA